MKTEFDKSLTRVLVHEGGKVDDPRDPGGRTNQGVTQKVFNAYLRSINKKERDVYTMKNTERDAIYKRRYWDAIDGDKLPPGVGYVLFDGAVNSGPMQSVKWLQRALGSRYSGKIDGNMGLLTVDAVDAFPDHDKLVECICDRRMVFLKALKTWKTFKGGWTDRVANVEATGQAWAMGSVGPAVVFIPGGEAKANIEDAKQPPIKALADMAAGTGGSTVVISQGIDQTKEQLAEFSNISFVSHILLALTLAGVALFAGGMVYRWFMRQYEKKLADALDLNNDKPRPGMAVPNA